METMLVTKLTQTLELLEKSHMTFIGPMCPIANVEEVDYPEGTMEVLKKLGYRYVANVVKLSYNTWSHKLSVNVELQNCGVAPMYFPWTVCIYFLSEDGEVLERYETDADLTSLVGGGSLTVSLTKEYIPKETGEVFPIVAIGIENPDTNEPEVRLAMDVENVGLRYILNR
jgi:hypothetical protein